MAKPRRASAGAAPILPNTNCLKMSTFISSLSDKRRTLDVSDITEESIKEVSSVGGGTYGLPIGVNSFTIVSLEARVSAKGNPTVFGRFSNGKFQYFGGPDAGKLMRHMKDNGGEPFVIKCFVTEQNMEDGGRLATVDHVEILTVATEKAETSDKPDATSKLFKEKAEKA